MAHCKPNLNVIVSRVAANDVFEIWCANFRRYDEVHADQYETFLKQGIESLSHDYDSGKVLEGFPELRRLTLKRSTRGEGHIVIYQIDTQSEAVYVLHVFHTRMDIAARIRDESQ